MRTRTCMAMMSFTKMIMNTRMSLLAVVLVEASGEECQELWAEVATAVVISTKMITMAAGMAMTMAMMTICRLTTSFI